MSVPVVRVGIGVIVFRQNENGLDEEILLGVRGKGKVGAGTWQCSGGSMEFGESFETAGLRELGEETGIIAKSAKFVIATNNPFPEDNQHWVTIWMSVRVPPGTEAKNLEPHKCERWEWHSIKNLPTPLFEGSGVLTTGTLIRIIQEELDEKSLNG